MFFQLTKIAGLILFLGAALLVSARSGGQESGGPAAPFTFQNPDFNFRSLRGNAVFRWEFRPGSVMYVAWAHDRAQNSPLGDFDFSRDWNGLRSAMPNNVFLVKASFWMPT